MIVANVKLTPNADNTAWTFETLDGVQTIYLQDRSEEGKSDRYMWRRTPRSMTQFQYELEDMVKMIRDDRYHIIGEDGIAVFLTEEEYLETVE